MGCFHNTYYKYVFYFQFRTRGWSDPPLMRDTMTSTGNMLNTTLRETQPQRPKPPPEQFNTKMEVCYNTLWMQFQRHQGGLATRSASKNMNVNVRKFCCKNLTF